LVYCPKRIVYLYKGMVLRNILAVLDNNNNLGRKVIKKKLYYSKATKQYFEKDVYEPKSGKWRLNLVDKITQAVSDTTLLVISDKVKELLYPWSIPKNIAQVEKPSKEELAKKRQYRKK
jgi:hypothetical protein